MIAKIAISEKDARLLPDRLVFEVASKVARDRYRGYYKKNSEIP
jgi:hypothetical protein